MSYYLIGCETMSYYLIGCEKQRVIYLVGCGTMSDLFDWL